MRATRAIVGSFGAGISLAIASSLILMIVSSVVAFRGWPDDLSGSTSEPSVARLSDDGQGSTSSAGIASSVSLPAAPTLKTVTHKQRRANGRSDSGDTAGANDSGSSTQSSTTATDNGRGGSSTGTQSGSGSADKASPGSQVTNTVHKAAGTAADTTKAVGDAVTPVAPDLGRTLETVGASGAPVLDKVGETAGRVVESVLG